MATDDLTVQQAADEVERLLASKPTGHAAPAEVDRLLVLAKKDKAVRL